MKHEINQSYEKYTARKRIIVLIVILLIIVFSIFSICAGSSNIKPYQVIMTVFGNGDGISDVVIWNIRLPRVLAAIIAGAGLSVSGCVMQSNLRNPLASPSTLGISSAAAFGANLAIIVFGAGSIKSSSADAVLINNPYIVTICAFCFSMMATFIILMIAKLKALSSEAVLLAGVAIGSLFSAGITLIQYFAQDVQVAAVVFWTFGDLGRASWREVIIMMVLIIISIVYFVVRQWDYNAIDSGEETAKSLGVNVERIRFGGLFVASLITAAAVSFLGIIGFIGLIGPQVMRRVIGGDHRFLLLGSALMGSLLLLISDTFARTIISPIVLPVGAITSFLGAPMFLYLLMRGDKRK